MRESCCEGESWASTYPPTNNTMPEARPLPPSQIGSATPKNWRHSESRWAVGIMFIRKKKSPRVSARKPGTTAWKSLGLIAWLASSRAPISPIGSAIGSMPWSFMPEARPEAVAAARKIRQSRKPKPYPSRVCRAKARHSVFQQIQG